MLAIIQSSAVVGIDAYPVAVEVHTQKGLFRYKVVGLPDTAVKESEDRVQSAVKNSGFKVLRIIVQKIQHQQPVKPCLRGDRVVD